MRYIVYYIDKYVLFFTVTQKMGIGKWKIADMGFEGLCMLYYLDVEV